MLMMHVRDMRMTVPHPRMPMGMNVGFTRWIARQMLMLVVLVMHVGVGMLHGLMLVFVLVALSQV